MKNIGRTLIAAIAVAAALTIGGFHVGDGGLETVEAAGRPVSIDSCLISGSDVVCQLSTGSVPSSDDRKFYVYADEVFQYGTTGSVVAAVDAGTSVSVSFPLNYNTADSNLSRKFLIAVKQNGQMVQVSDEHYITNPEAIAAYTAGRMDNGIKGILPDLTKSSREEVQELGIKQVVYNMAVDDICSAASAPGALPFTYNGTTYYFDGNMIGKFDSMFKSFNHYGVQVNIVLLNRGESPY